MEPGFPMDLSGMADGSEVTTGIYIMWVVGFVGFTGAVAVGTYHIVSRMAKGKDAAEDFYNGGYALTWPYIFGSLMLTNLSTESLVGLNGTCWRDGNIAAMAWESTAALALILTTVVFLPRFYSQGFVTTPALLEQVFGMPLRTMVSLLFLGMYTTILLPANLYSCAIAFQTMFDIQWVPLWFLIAIVTAVGCIYAIGGGMKSVAVSDTLNGIGLLIGGVIVPLLALLRYSDKLSGNLERLGVLVPTINENHPLLQNYNVSMPWHTVFSGTLFIQIFYWSTNQVIVQRALCAKTFAHGQKGLLLAAVFKMLGPFMLCIVGAVALGLDMKTDLGITNWDSGVSGGCGAGPYASGSECYSAAAAQVDRIYPAMVKLTLPAWSLGVFAAVLLGSALSSFNSGIASASTLWAMEIYPFLKSDASDDEKVRSGRIVGFMIAVISAVLGNVFPLMGDGVFNLVRKYKHVFGLPILVLFLLAISSKRASRQGAWFSLVVCMILYQLAVTFDGEGSFADIIGLNQIHWLHRYLMCLVLGYLSYEVYARVTDAPEKVESQTSKRECNPWIHTNKSSLAIVVILAVMYFALTFPSMVTLSAFGLAWVALALFFFFDQSADLESMKSELNEEAGIPLS